VQRAASSLPGFGVSPKKLFSSFLRAAAGGEKDLATALRQEEEET